MDRDLTAIGILAVISLLVLSACGGGEGDGTNSNSSAEPGQESVAGVPTSREGDNSIQTYGREGNANQRARLSAIVQAYFDARTDRDWRKACFLLAASQRAEYENLSRSGSCAQTMRTLMAQVPDRALAEETQIEVLTLREEGDHAFLIYRRPDHTVYAMPLAREDGKWKVGLVTPTALE
jgi:hypothetical protein